VSSGNIWEEFLHPSVIAIDHEDQSFQRDQSLTAMTQRGPQGCLEACWLLEDSARTVSNDN